MLDFIIPSSKNNAQAQMASSLSAGGDTIQLYSGESALFPAGANDNTTSAGDQNTLNCTGIGAMVSVGQFIRNITDGSIGWILTVSTNSVTTTALIGGSDNTWDSGDEWVVGSHYMWLSKKDGSGEDTTRELVLVKYIDSSSDQIKIETRGVEGTATAFDADDFCSVYVSSQYTEQMGLAIGELMRRKAEDDEVVHLSGDETIAGVKTFSTLPQQASYVAPTEPEELTPKAYVDANSGRSNVIFGYSTAKEEILKGKAFRNALSGSNSINFSTSSAYQFRYNTAKQRVGRLFTVNANYGSYAVSSITIHLQRVGTISGNVTMKLYENDKTTLVATSTTTLDASTITTGGTSTSYAFAFSALSLTPGTEYFVEVNSTVSISTSNYMYIYGTNTDSTLLYYDGTNWAGSTTNDLGITIAYAEEAGYYLALGVYPFSTVLGICTLDASISDVVQGLVRGINENQTGLEAIGGDTIKLSDTVKGLLVKSSGSGVTISGIRGLDANTVYIDKL